MWSLFNTNLVSVRRPESLMWGNTPITLGTATNEPVTLFFLVLFFPPDPSLEACSNEDTEKGDSVALNI